MISSLPENLQALFAPRPPLDYLPPPERKKRDPYSGFSAYSQFFETPDSTNLDKDDLLHVENREQKKDRIQKQRKQKQEKTIEQKLQECNYQLFSCKNKK